MKHSCCASLTVQRSLGLDLTRHDFLGEWNYFLNTMAITAPPPGGRVDRHRATTDRTIGNAPG